MFISSIISLVKMIVDAAVEVEVKSVDGSMLTLTFNKTYLSLTRSKVLKRCNL
jgi:hypothetical protein